MVRSERFTIRLCTNAAEWDKFVESIPWTTPQHFFVWGETLASCFSYLRMAYRLLCENGEIVAALPLIRFTAVPPFRACYSLSFDSYGGPLIKPEYLDDPELLSTISYEIDSEAARQKAFEVRFSLPPATPNVVTQCLQQFDTTLTLTRSCPLLYLNEPLEKIQQRYKASVRRAVRRSSRMGVLVEENVDIGRVRETWPIYKATMKRIGGTAKPFRFVEPLLRKKLAVSFVASLDRRPIGIVVLLVSSNWAIYWLSGANISHTTYRPTNALLDRAIRWCHTQGIRVFSFGESFQERPGLIRFKKGWGPTSAESSVMIRIYKPRVQRIWHVLEPIARTTYALLNELRESIS